MRKKHNDGFKFKVALASMKGDMTIAEICKTYDVAASLVHKWKKQLLEQGADIFSKDKSRKVAAKTQEKEAEKLYQTIGQLTVERDFLKKSWENLSGQSD